MNYKAGLVEEDGKWSQGQGDRVPRLGLIAHTFAAAFALWPCSHFYHSPCDII